jgi:hypothetical protein
MNPPRAITPDLLAEAERLIRDKGMSATAAAHKLGLSESGLRGARKRGARTPKGERPSVTIDGDEANVTTGVTTDLQDIDGLLRDRKLDPADWDVVECIVNTWEGPAGEGEVRTYHQFKLRLRRKMGALFVGPAVHVPALTKRTVRSVRRGKPEYVLVEGDSQCPYHDKALDAAIVALIAELQPAEHVFNGDLCDFPTISKHADHPAALATAQECIDAGYHHLRRRAEAAPNAKRYFLRGNHDWRLEQELLLRAERMWGIKPADEDLPALSLKRLLHLDALGVELVDHPLGWEHAEVEIVPGEHGLVARHGWLTGHNSAEKSMLKRGRSLIVNHGHGRQHVFRWDPSAGVERQAIMCPTTSQARGGEFPHFAVCDDWLQGCVVVTRWPDGKWQAEHARWDGRELLWRDTRVAA